ncbi:PTS sugar transporter subunit IIA [Paenibacillus flagellatus]|uniref:PTS sugar transporter subunit IIA n=1 Tax=Paenibacillus flagellatus TaxID=2211139 RepID=A0A2V5JXD0_9BACL|nr:PTS sugar transporter subunit IIA [Paenibacillus flagellatus]PYI51499.1 PTS sugar transporter subunit IIA [Paenibacillus flagellatus]
MKFIPADLIALDRLADTAEDAIRAAGELLAASGAADAAYTEAMVEAYREKGPYFVLAPGIALPHAKAERGVREASVSFVRLSRPIRFGHKTNDPVDLVFALGSASNAEHIAMLRRLTVALNDPANIAALRRAETAEDVVALFAGEIA